MSNPVVINRWKTIGTNGKKLGTGRNSDERTVMYRDGKWDITWCVREVNGTGFFSRVGEPYDTRELANAALTLLENKS